MKRISGASAPYPQANAARVVSEDETSCINKRLFTSFVARVPSNYLKKHPALPRHEAPRCSPQGRKGESRSYQGWAPAYSKIDDGSGWFHFVTTI